MKLNKHREIEKSLVSTTITIKEFDGGKNGLSPEEERQCLQNWKIIIDYSNMIFDRFINIDENHEPYIVEVPEPDGGNETPTIEGDRVRFSISEEPVLVDENLELHLAVDANALKNDMSLYSYIQDTKDLAMAYIIIFEDVIEKYLADEINENFLHFNSFEGDVVVQI